MKYAAAGATDRLNGRGKFFVNAKEKVEISSGLQEGVGHLGGLELW